jgi:hypothetical protein
MNRTRVLPFDGHRLNSSASDESFLQSCQRIRDRSKSIDETIVNAILIKDHCRKPVISYGKEVYVWYFAIGSMINPVSMYLRGLTPLTSYPARCPHYQLVFRQPCGMADIEESKENEFHGVVHLLPMEQMRSLDQVEHMYRRLIVNVHNYRGEAHRVFVYKMNPIASEEPLKSLPTERYLDIIVKGCEHFCVCPSYVHRLKYHQAVIPRKSPNDYKRIENVPDNNRFTLIDLCSHDGSDPNVPMWICINGKILQYDGLPNDDDPDYQAQQRFNEFIRTALAGREVAHVIAKTWYEPMYSLPVNEHDLCDGQRALAEDMCASWGLNNAHHQHRQSSWKPIGKLVSIDEATVVHG